MEPVRAQRPGTHHPHYAYKLEWLETLRAAAGAWLEADPSLPLALVGDWNVAPWDEDVWDMGAFEGATHVSAPEREAFAAFEGVGMHEVTRERVTNYTYWDYQKLRFPKNEGMRIDFAYASPALAARVSGAAIDATSARAGRLRPCARHHRSRLTPHRPRLPSFALVRDAEYDFPLKSWDSLPEVAIDHRAPVCIPGGLRT